MEKPTVDPKRTCKAIQAAHDDPVMQPGHYDFTEPGKARRLDNDHLLFACPGCGLTGAIVATDPKSKDKPSWKIVGGSLDDVTTLTLDPSIDCIGCCRWHGYLKNGVFVSC